MVQITNSQVRVDAGITSGTGQVFVLAVGNVKVRLWVAVLFGEAKIDDIDLIATFADAHEEVVRLDITVDEGLCMDVFDTGDELISKQENRLESEATIAEVEEILETGAKEVQDHGIIVAFGAEPADEGNADTTGQRLVNASFILKLRVLSLDALELDSNLLARDDVGACNGERR